MCELGPRCGTPEYDYAITPRIPLRLVGEFSGTHRAPPVGCGYFSGIALKKLHDHGSTTDLAEVISSRLEVYQARESFLIQRGLVERNEQILTHRHSIPLQPPQAVAFLSSLGLEGYNRHPVLGQITRENMSEQIEHFMVMGLQVSDQPVQRYGIMVSHLLSGINAHWISILQAARPDGFLVYDPCGAAGYADHVRLIPPDEMSSYYGDFPWDSIISHRALPAP